MKSTARKPAVRRLGAPLAATALAALWSAAVPLNSEGAVGNTSGNAIVRNTITVSYNDAMGKNGATATATVDITVTTVSATPSQLNTITAGTTDGSTATQLYNLRIRTNSNGPRAVALTAADTTGTNISPLGAAAVVSPSSVFLGATIIDPTDANGTIANWGVGGSITFKVPNDGGLPTDLAETGGSNGDGVVNGLKSGDIAYLYAGGSNYYGPFSVGTVTEVAAGAGATAAADSIQLVNNLGAPAYTSLATAPGWQILEAKDVTVTVSQGTVTDPTAPGGASWNTTFSATMTGATAYSQTLTTNAEMGKIAISKYARNASAAVAGSTPYASVTINGATYSTANGNAFYASGVSGKPGDTLEYLAVVSNVGSGKSTAVLASDLIPTYSTLVTGSAYGSGSGNIFAHAKLGGNEIDMATTGTGVNTVGFGGSTGTSAGSTMTFDLGTGSAWGTGGNLASGQTAYIIYQVKIN
jgi:uncharacterized repeat protein (TIGR01451 family)